MGEHGTLERGWRKRHLIHELARKEKTRVALAKAYGVTQPAITQFAKRHAAEIAQVEAEIENQFAGLWIASKVNRLAEYQQAVEDIDEILSTWQTLLDAVQRGIEGAEDVPEHWIDLAQQLMDGRTGTATPGPEWLRTKARLLRSVAEEIGDLRVDVRLSGTTVHYLIEGVDPKDLE